MLATYRNMLPEDEEAVFTLRMRTWGHPSIEHVRRSAYSDPRYLQHTFMALAPDGTLLATVRYWLRRIRDASGASRLVGCVASVVTIAAARRQGHAGRLMQLALTSMRDEGCDWSLLFSSSMGVPRYEGLGYHFYPAPYFRGVLVGGHQAPDRIAGPGATAADATAGITGIYSITRTEAPFAVTDPNWQATKGIYAAYNAWRPLSMVRDEDYWQSYFSPSLATARRQGTVSLFLASRQDQPVAYLLTRVLSAEAARDYFNAERGFVITEAGMLTGHDTALPALLYAMRQELLLLLVSQLSQQSQLPQSPEWEVPGAAFLPRQALLEEALRAVFGQTLYLSGARRRMMALPLGQRFSESELTATFAAPGALFWPMDAF
jgi:GNAT superfamily N-acetyltransferase